MLLAIDDLIPTAHQFGNSLFAVGHSKGLVHASYWNDEPANALAEWSALPNLVPVIAERQGDFPYMTVVADRTGADIEVVSQSLVAKTQVGTNDGPITKVHGGGWSHRRYQQRAENTWEHNAKDVASTVAALSRENSVRCVFLAGDVRAVQMVRDDLKNHEHIDPVLVEGSRSADGSQPIDESQISAHLRSLALGNENSLLAKLQEELGQADRAVTGAAGVIRALTMSQVEVLIVGLNSPDSFDVNSMLVNQTAYCGSQPQHIASSTSEMEAMGVHECQRTSLVDAAVRSALTSGAGVFASAQLPNNTDGIAAILRWT